MQEVFAVSSPITATVMPVGITLIQEIPPAEVYVTVQRFVVVIWSRLNGRKLEDGMVIGMKMVPESVSSADIITVCMVMKQPMHGIMAKINGLARSVAVEPRMIPEPVGEQPTICPVLLQKDISVGRQLRP